MSVVSNLEPKATKPEFVCYLCKKIYRDEGCYRFHMNKQKYPRCFSKENYDNLVDELEKYKQLALK